jgi:hypothetical protein
MTGRRYWLPKCGAVTRQGRPCKRKPVLLPDGRVRNGRCINHGGVSTGPKKHHDRCTAGRVALYKRRRAAGHRPQAETRATDKRKACMAYANGSGAQS